MARVQILNGKPLVWQGKAIETGQATGSRNNMARWMLAFTPQLREMIGEAAGDSLSRVEEIRLRINRPLIIRMGHTELTVNGEKKLTSRLTEGYLVTGSEIEKTFQLLSSSSLYAWEDEFKNGYLTIPGGHRVGFTGRGVLDKGMIKTMKDISSLNFRLGREILGCADPIMSLILAPQGLYHTLIISPPQCGKTTLLRDMVRQLSDGFGNNCGNKKYSFPGVNVGLADERSEIAGVYQGEPQFSIGLRTDVLDACPKAQGIMMLIRSMSPVVIATDEIGRSEDVEALYQALHAGVTVVTTVHGLNLEDIGRRPYLKELLERGFFHRLVVLSRRKGPGTLEGVWDGKTMERVRE